MTVDLTSAAPGGFSLSAHTCGFGTVSLLNYLYRKFFKNNFEICIHKQHKLDN